MKEFFNKKEIVVSFFISIIIFFTAWFNNFWADDFKTIKGAKYFIFHFPFKIIYFSSSYNSHLINELGITINQNRLFICLNYLICFLSVFIISKIIIYFRDK